MRKYRRVTYADRCQIDAHLSAGFNRSEIATKLGFNKATICRELKRNQYAQRYQPLRAQKLTERRYQNCRKPYLIQEKLSLLIYKKLSEGWSPEQISGRLRDEGVSRISHQGIYNHIARNKETFAPLLRRYGKRGGGRYLQRKAKQKFLSILKRPELVSRRQRYGDWERDGMHVANHEQILVLNERKSRYVRLKKMGRGIPKFVTHLTNEILQQLPIKSYTITNDNGPEFRDSLNQGIPVYHCIPRRPQQRGTVENTIGLLRQFINRKTDINTLDEEKLNEIERKINFRPRKCLDYKTPHELLFKEKVALAI